MIYVKIEHEKPMSIMGIVAELREFGYKQKVDFDFCYHPAVFDSVEATPRHTIFTFYDESIASWFALRYC